MTVYLLNKYIFLCISFCNEVMRRLEVRLKEFGKEEEKVRMEVNEKHLNEFGRVMFK